MKVGSVSSVYYQPKSARPAVRKTQTETIPKESNNVNFKGKFGQILGGTLGAIAVIAISTVAPPALICLTGAGAAIGATGLDVAEDKINKEGYFKEKKNNNNG